jgi:hypothetical protein
VALVERGGRAVAKPTIDATSGTLSPIVRANVDLSATLMTDRWRGYIMVGREFAGGHHRVDHGAGEYARGSAHVNTAESFFALSCIAIATSSRSGGITGQSRARREPRSRFVKPRESG